MQIISDNAVLPDQKEKEEFCERNLPQVVRSDGTGDPERFDPNKIKESIIQEVQLPEGEANKLTEEMCLMLMGKKVVTAPFIREQMCNLLFRHNEISRFKYTRLGIPYFDFKKEYGEIFDQFETWEDLTDENIKEKVIAALDPKKIIELIRRIAKDYVGVRNKIRSEEVIQRLRKSRK